MKFVGKIFSVTAMGFMSGALAALLVEVTSTLVVEKRYIDLTREWIRQFGSESGDSDIQLIAERYANNFMRVWK